MPRKKNRSKVRYARVPSGGETCPFCMMLASRGAVYHSEATAGGDGHYHAHCRCRIVPVFGDQQIEGYDPSEWYRKWQTTIQEEGQEKWVQSKVHSGERTAWKNETIEAIQDTNTLVSWLEETHEIRVSDAFRSLPFEHQKAICAGVDDAAKAYGVSSVRKIEITTLRGADGKYSTDGIIKIAKNCSDYYLTAVHEYAHGVDYFRSPVGRFEFGRGLVKDACKTMRLKVGSEAFYDAILPIARYNVGLCDYLADDLDELFAWTLEYNMKKRALLATGAQVGDCPFADCVLSLFNEAV